MKLHVNGTERKQEADIHDAEVGLRVQADPGGEWVLLADHRRSGDQVVEHAGVTVLLVSEDVQSALAGTRVDCLETPDGTVRLALMQATAEDDDP
jgi:hypothetical protein